MALHGASQGSFFRVIRRVFVRILLMVPHLQGALQAPGEVSQVSPR